MFKAEIYKLFHCRNLSFLFLIVIFVAIFLGIVIPEPFDINELLSLAFLGSSAVLILYMTIHAAMFINRDYNANSYRIMIGTGMNRQAIIFAKYVTYMISALFIVFAHVFLSMISASTKIVIFVNSSIFIDVFLYALCHIAIISIVFLLSITGRTILLSITLNTGFIIISSVFSQWHMNDNSVPLSPMQLLQVVAEHQTDRYLHVIIICLIYALASYILSQIIFNQQEL